MTFERKFGDLDCIVCGVHSYPDWKVFSENIHWIVYPKNMDDSVSVGISNDALKNNIENADRIIDTFYSQKYQ